MLQITDYDLLVLKGFEALKREIAEAEQYTVNHYNNIVQQQKQAEQAQQSSVNQQNKTSEQTDESKQNKSKTTK